MLKSRGTHKALVKMGLTLETVPETEPVSLAELKAAQKIDGTDEDAFLTLCLESARQEVERILGQQLVEASWVETFPAFPCARTLRLSKYPLLTVEKIEYLDDGGTLVELSDAQYAVLIDREPGEVQLKPDYSWPSTYLQADAVQVSYTAGYGEAADVPAILKTHILYIAGTLAANREATAADVLKAAPFIERALLGQRAEVFT